jgi:hypothetical protein
LYATVRAGRVAFLLTLTAIKRIEAISQKERSRWRSGGGKTLFVVRTANGVSGFILKLSEGASEKVCGVLVEVCVRFVFVGNCNRQSEASVSPNEAQNYQLGRKRAFVEYKLGYNGNAGGVR